MEKSRTVSWLFYALVVGALVASPAAAWDVGPVNSQDGTIIPDVDKVDFDDHTDASCWQAAASNLLAAGGWGKGSLNQTAQKRAEYIYAQMNGLWGINACGNVANAMNTWLQTWGQNPNCITGDYDPNNLYTNVTVTQWTLKCPDYQTLLDDLKLASPKYPAVLLRVNDDTNHWLTLIGGDYCDGDDETTEQSLWHDSDRDQGGVDNNPYDNLFPLDGTWDLPTYVLHDADEYDRLCKVPPDLKLTPMKVENYHYGRWGDPADPYGAPLTAENGQQADNYDDPVFETDLVLLIDNELDMSRPKEIELLIDYAGSADMSVEDDIYLLVEGVPFWPTITSTADDNGMILFEWVLPYQPAEERIVFPNDKYKYMILDESAGRDVVSFQLATYCVPEPATLSLLLILGAFLPLLRNRR